jgi:hypothetical protein
MRWDFRKRKWSAAVVALFLAACGAGSLDTGEQTVALKAASTTAEVPKWLEGRPQTSNALDGPELELPASTLKADQQLLALSDPIVPKSTAFLPLKIGPTYIVRALADFDGDGKADVLWQANGGDTYITRMNGAVADSCAKIGTYSASVMGTGDFNGDGKSDIVWRNMTTGAVSISLMNGAIVSQSLNVGASPIALNVKLEAIGDFDGNGRADMLWRNQSTGRSVMSYHHADGSVANWPVVSNFINPATTTAFKVGDLNGDGKDDIVWRNMSTGNVVISLMDGSIPSWRGITDSPIPLSVALEAIGDFDNNGKADLLWRNTATGRSLMSYHNADGSVASWPVVSNFINPASTSAVGVGDLDGDGKSDILWMNLSTGNAVTSLMNGNLPSWLATNFKKLCGFLDVVCGDVLPDATSAQLPAGYSAHTLVANLFGSGPQESQLQINSKGDVAWTMANPAIAGVTSTYLYRASDQQVLETGTVGWTTMVSLNDQSQVMVVQGTSMGIMDQNIPISQLPKAIVWDGQSSAVINVPGPTIINHKPGRFTFMLPMSGVTDGSNRAWAYPMFPSFYASGTLLPSATGNLSLALGPFPRGVNQCGTAVYQGSFVSGGIELMRGMTSYALRTFQYANPSKHSILVGGINDRETVWGAFTNFMVMDTLPTAFMKKSNGTEWTYENATINDVNDAHVGIGIEQKRIPSTVGNVVVPKQGLLFTSNGYTPLLSKVPALDGVVDMLVPLKINNQGKIVAYGCSNTVYGSCLATSLYLLTPQ